MKQDTAHVGVYQMMKRILILPILLLLLVSPVSAHASGPACNLSTLVIPNFGPDWIIATLTGLDPTATYFITLVQPDATTLQTDSDYGNTFNQQTFSVGTFQSGFYYGILQKSGSNTVLASCRVQP